MPILDILTQPEANSLNAAVRPVILRVLATATTGQPQPPVVYCDIYVNSVYYRTIGRSQPDQINDFNTEWQFDIQDVQELFTGRFIPPNGGKAILQPLGLHLLVFCRFRSSYLDDFNIIQPDTDIPVQATSSTPAVEGSGYQSNTFIALNATLQHKDNPLLNAHLQAYRHGTWDSQAYPLTHRPNNYVLGRNDSDFFPFIYVGNRAVSCIQVNLLRKDGTTITLSSCEEAKPCAIAVRNVRIQKAVDQGDGRTYYNAIFAVNNTADHYKIELSYDNTNWIDITAVPDYHAIVNFSTLTYNARPDGGQSDHQIRITPFCDLLSAGQPGTAAYTLPVCPQVTGLTITYNAQTQRLSYSFTAPDNTNNAVQLWQNDVEYAPLNNIAPPSGGWTIIDSGTFYVTVMTYCNVGENITVRSNSISITIANAVCNPPKNATAAFENDGKQLRVTWQVDDFDYPDVVFWYNAANNTLLSQSVAVMSAFTATLDVTAYPEVQQFYATVQHQCPSPSVLAKSNIIQRSNNYTLSLEYNNDRTAISVTCHRYNVLTPAPFTANVRIAIKYQSASTGFVETEATGYMIKGETSNQLFGSAGINIITANIVEVTPTVVGNVGYVF